MTKDLSHIRKAVTGTAGTRKCDVVESRLEAVKQLCFVFFFLPDISQSALLNVFNFHFFIAVLYPCMTDCNGLSKNCVIKQSPGFYWSLESLGSSVLSASEYTKLYPTGPIIGSDDRLPWNRLLGSKEKVTDYYLP